MLFLLLPIGALAADKITVFPLQNTGDTEHWLSVGLHEGLNTDLGYVSARETRDLEAVNILIAQHCPGLTLTCVNSLKLNQWKQIAKRARLDAFIWGSYKVENNRVRVSLKLYPNRAQDLSKGISYQSHLKNLLLESSHRLLELLDKNDIRVTPQEGKRILAVKTRYPEMWKQYSLAYWLGHQALYGMGTNISVIPDKKNSRLFNNQFVGQTLSVNFDKIQVQHFFQHLSEFTQLHIQLHDSLPDSIKSDKLGLKFNNKPWDMILWHVLQKKKLHLQAHVSGLPLIIVVDDQGYQDAKRKELLARQASAELGPTLFSSMRDINLGLLNRQITLLLNVVRRDPRYAEAMTELIAARLKINPHHENNKELDFSRPLDLKPWLIKANLFQAQLTKDSKLLQKAMSVNPSNTYLKKVLAKLYYEKKAFNDAVATLVDYQMVFPRDYEAKQLECDSLWQQNSEEQARQCSLHVLQKGDHYRTSAAEALGYYPHKIPPDKLIAQLKASKGRLKAYLLIALRDVDSPNAIDQLLRAAGDKDPYIRGAAIKILTGHSSEAFNRICTRLIKQEYYAAIRSLSLKALEDTRDGDAIAAIVYMAMEDKNEYLRQAAINHLHRSISTIALANNITALLPLLESENSVLQTHALDLMNKVVRKEHVSSIASLSPHLVKLLNDISTPEKIRDKVQNMANAIIHLLSDKEDKKTSIVLAGFLKVGDYAMQEQTIMALKRSATKEAAPHLTRFLALSDNDFLILSASQVLVKIQATKAIPDLLKLADRPSFREKHYLRNELVNILARFNSDKARTEFKRGLRHSSTHIKSLSANVLAKLDEAKGYKSAPLE